MKILVFGNLGSGKSTVLRYIGDRLPGFDRISIDDFRRIHGDGTMSGERRAKELFINAVTPDANQIIEATGCRETAALLSQQLLTSEERKIILLIDTPLETCLKRLEQRVWDVPYPASPKMAFSLARETDNRIRSGEPTDHWKGHRITKVITHPCIHQTHLKSIWKELRTTLNT